MIKRFEQFNINDPYGEEDWKEDRYDYINFKGSLREFLESIREDSQTIDAALKCIDRKECLEDMVTIIMTGLRDLGVNRDNRNKIYEDLYDYMEVKFLTF